MSENTRTRYVALRILESVCFVHGTVKPTGQDSNRIDLQFVMEFEEAQADLAPWIASGKRVVADLKVVDDKGHPANTPIGAFQNPVLDGGEIMAPTGSGDNASVALYVSSGHFDFLAAHRAQWDRLLVRVQPSSTNEGTRLAITGYTFTDRKARLSQK